MTNTKNFLWTIAFAGSLCIGSAWLGAVVSQAKQDNDPVVPTTAAANDLVANQKRLESLTLEQRDKLSRLKRDFDKRSKVEKERAKEFHQTLINHKDYEKLHGVMMRYYNWIESLDPDVQIELLDLPIDERLAKIKMIKKDEALNNFGRVGSVELPVKDVETVFNWFEKFTEDNKSILNSRLQKRENTRKLMEAMTTPIFEEKRQFDAVRRKGRVALLIFVDPDFVGDLLFKNLESLQRQLSFEALEILYNMSDENQKILLVNWYAAVQEAKMQRPDEQGLQEFAATLPQEERDQLNSLTPQAYKSAIMEKWEQHYSEMRFGSRRSRSRPTRENQ